ncbi:acyl-CoA dehydrogenase family protein [Chloroflexota bacterium]
MNFELSDRQKLLSKSIREFARRQVPDALVRDIDDGPIGFSPDIWREMSSLGWTGWIFPEEYGGLGGSILDLAVMYEEFGRALIPSPHLSTVVLCGLTILMAGTDEQKAELLHKIAKGNLILALAFTEPSARWDAGGIDVRANPEGDEYIINGTKLFVHDAHISDYLICVARTKDASDPKDGITLFLVDNKAAGLSCTLLKTTSSDNKQSEVVFNNVRVPRSHIIGRLHCGWSVLEKVLKHGAIMLCAEMVGAGERLLEMTVEYAKTRVQFEQPIGINQYVQEHCVYLLAEVKGSKRVTYQAAWMLSDGLPCDMEVAIAKAWTSDAHERACWRAHSVFAGIGSVTGMGTLYIFTKRAKTSQLYLGDAAYHRNKVAQQLDNWTLEMPKGKPLGLWDKEQVSCWP